MTYRIQITVVSTGKTTLTEWTVDESKVKAQLKFMRATDKANGFGGQLKYKAVKAE